jgi:hypothetical protein
LAPHPAVDRCCEVGIEIGMAKNFLSLIYSFLLFGFYFQSSASVSNSNVNNNMQQEQQQEKRQKNDEQIKKCLELGFNSQTLSCSMCIKMKQIVNDEILTKECQDCCSNELINENEKYELIVLEIDKKYLKNNEELSQFLKEDNGVSNQIVLRHKYLMIPTLLMYHERNDLEPSRVMNIGSWSLEEIKEFLKSHVIENE